MMSRPEIAASRVRYRREVTPEHVGSRISVRFLVDDVDGPRPTDRVGRLLSYEDDGMIVVDRAGTLHVVDPADVIASRVVPPNPRLPDEPRASGPEDALHREAARVLVLDDTDRVLLISHLPGDGRRVWTAPGGGLDPGEHHEAAAGRELREELGIRPPIGPCVWTRTARFAFRGIWLEQSERWFLVRVTSDGAPDVDDLPLADLATEGARWWSLDELLTSAEILAPRALPQHLATLLRDGPPDQPVDVGA
jgi:ADP-ribose pyrophosphatase YjhB (NUDIX family)